MIEASFKFTPEVLAEAFRRHQQHRSPAHLAWSLIAILTPIVILGFVEGAWFATLLIDLGLITLLAAPYAGAWFAIRSFRNSPFCNERIVQRFDETGLRETSGKSDSQFAWSSFTKVVHFDDGFLLFSGPKLFRWIPFVAFALPDEVRGFHELLRTNLKEHEFAKKTTGIKGQLKLVVCSLYRDLIGAKASGNRHSKIYHWLLIGFVISLVAVVACAVIANDSAYWMFASFTLVFSLVFCGIAFLCAVAAEGFRNWKRNHWRFGLRDLLVAITVAALAFGGMIYAARG